MAIDPNAVSYAASETAINARSVISVLDLLVNQEATIPFITRYRKEVTGGLDEVQIRNIKDSYEGYLEREKRRAYILESLKKSELLTKELEKKILEAQTLNQLEDIYAPYKSKKKSKAQKAVEAGLAPLAKLIKTSSKKVAQIAQEMGAKFLNPEMKINNFQDAFEGACHIIIEEIAHNTDVKDQLRNFYWKEAKIKSSKKKQAEEVTDWEKFKDYFEFEQLASDLKEAKNSHRFLAVRRGMTQKVLKVEVTYPEESAILFISGSLFEDQNIANIDIVNLCVRKAYLNHIHPSLDLEIKSELKKQSDTQAIDVFGVNLKNLLLGPYLGPKAVLGIDPGVRTGCKVVVVDNTGKFLVDTIIYPHPPRNDKNASKTILEAMIDQFKIEYIAIGNGTYGRETLQFIEENVIQVKDKKVNATMISESGASIYSASDIARKEFPDKDPTVRGAISIARRFQDPLAELVKIDPKSIGVGQYQHDVNQAKLKKGLTGVVESCVNYVGVDLNTASAPLLSYISGIGPTVADNIVKKREKDGIIKSRDELQSITRFSSKVFEQAAGFLRIYNGENPLDGTSIHPERYEVLSKWCESQGLLLTELVSKKEVIKKLETDKTFINEVGEYTHQDIIKSLMAPSQDPRTEFKSFEFRKDISTISDLKVGQSYPGVVTNITQFGAFVDIGIKENGLVHISQMADKFVENPLEVLKIGQEVRARVIDVDPSRKRVALSLKSGDGKSEFVPNQSSQKSKKNFSNKAIKNNAFAALKNFKV